MSIVEQFIKNFRWVKHNIKLDKAMASGEFKPFDDEFYRQFDGKYYNALPIRYYLQKLNMGKCYDTSAILALALGDDNNYVVRGELAERSKLSGEIFGHGWVETEDKVLDTTWQIVADKDAYYRVFGVKDERKRTAKQFFEDCKEMSDWTIHDKEYYYENNYVPLIYGIVLGVHSILNNNIEFSRNDDEKNYYKGLLEELPDINKVQSFPESVMYN